MRSEQPESVGHGLRAAEWSKRNFARAHRRRHYFERPGRRRAGLPRRSARLSEQQQSR